MRTEAPSGKKIAATQQLTQRRTISRRFLRVCVGSLMFVLFASSGYSDNSPPAPSAELQPHQVVKIVVEALRTNNPDNNDDGIATVFEFASPGNKSVTGPVERFARMIRGGFSDMLNHVKSEFGEMEINNDTALQAVWLTTRFGGRTGYVFQLGKQQSGQFEGMWMTEAVWPIGVKNRRASLSDITL